MHRQRRALEIAVLFTFVFGIAETIARQWNFVDDFWYRGAVKKMESSPTPIQVLVIGTSRVAAAVDPVEFANHVRSISGQSCGILTLGQGFSNLLEHFLGLQTLDRANSDFLNGLDVLIEAPTGLPDRSTFRDSWYFEEQPALLITVLHRNDIVRLWKSGMTFEHKLKATVRFCLSASRLVTFRERIRDAVLSHVVATGNRMMPVTRKLHLSGSHPDLTEIGGVRVDQRGIEAVRRNASIGADLATINQSSIDEDWEATVVREIVDLVRMRGGRVCFFEMPLSTVQARPYRTPIRVADRAQFRKVATQWETPILKPTLDEVSDEDFPDLWHMSTSKSVEFTRQLAVSWLRSKRSESKKTAKMKTAGGFIDPE